VTKDEALKLALEALETAWTYDEDNADGYYFEAITAIKQALAAPVQVPVAVARVDDLERGGRVRALAMGLALDAVLYTTPPAQPCPTCEALARTVMMDQTGRDA
jgi:hypothetical protein